MQDTRETRVQSRGQEDPLEEDMTTHVANLLAWRIPWAEEPGGLQSGGVSNSETRLGTQHTHKHPKPEEDRRGPPPSVGLPPGLRESESPRFYVIQFRAAAARASKAVPVAEESSISRL